MQVDDWVLSSVENKHTRSRYCVERKVGWLQWSYKPINIIFHRSKWTSRIWWFWREHVLGTFAWCLAHRNDSNNQIRTLALANSVFSCGWDIYTEISCTSASIKLNKRNQSDFIQNEYLTHPQNILIVPNSTLETSRETTAKMKNNLNFVFFANLIN